MHGRVDADTFQRIQVKLLDVRWVRLHHHLKLVVMLQAVGVFAVAAIGRSTRWLHIGGIPGFGTECAQEGGGVKGAGAHFHIVGLQYHAALLGPILLQREDQILKCRGRCCGHGHCLRVVLEEPRIINAGVTVLPFAMSL
jgi:hypothetical protein